MDDSLEMTHFEIVDGVQKVLFYHETKLSLQSKFHPQGLKIITPEQDGATSSMEATSAKSSP